MYKVRAAPNPPGIIRAPCVQTSHSVRGFIHALANLAASTRAFLEEQVVLSSFLV